MDSRYRSLNVYGAYDLDAAAGAVEASIRPQVIGWYVLAGLAALAALAVIAQAMARQAATEQADHPVLSALGLRPRELVLAALVRALLIGVAGAAGAVLLAVLVSPLTPVGEARIAVPSPDTMSFDPVVLPLGALAVLAAVTRGVGLARGASCPACCPSPRPRQSALAVAASRAAGRAGLPAAAVSRDPACAR